MNRRLAGHMAVSAIDSLRTLSALPSRPNRYAVSAPATAALWFIDPLADTWLRLLVSTHPPIERRIARLHVLH